MASNFRRQQIVERLGIKQAPAVTVMAESTSHTEHGFEIPIRTRTVSLVASSVASKASANRHRFLIEKAVNALKAAKTAGPNLARIVTTVVLQLIMETILMSTEIIP